MITSLFLIIAGLFGAKISISVILAGISTILIGLGIKKSNGG